MSCSACKAVSCKAQQTCIVMSSVCTTCACMSGSAMYLYGTSVGRGTLTSRRKALSKLCSQCTTSARSRSSRQTPQPQIWWIHKPTATYAVELHVATIYINTFAATCSLSERCIVSCLGVAVAQAAKQAQASKQPRADLARLLHRSSLI